ncbi:MAG TPA: ribosome maturation factor RimM [Mycobacteriales bacterium]|jgi:16S rRNA processing protein RimM|nr:ribosome maturation factor RimM [Mycobacteriales bacterium]
MLLLTGRIGRPHGVRGLVTVEVVTDSPAQRFAVGASLIAEPAGSGPLTVTHQGWSGKTLLLGFDGVDGRDSAEALRGTELYVDSDQIPPPDDPEIFPDHQLIGLSAQRLDGEVLGKVIEVRHGPGSDYLVLSHDGREVLVPFVWAIVPEVDLAGGRVVIDPPAGLLEL